MATKKKLKPRSSVAKLEQAPQWVHDIIKAFSLDPASVHFSVCTPTMEYGSAIRATGQVVVQVSGLRTWAQK